MRHFFASRLLLAALAGSLLATSWVRGLKAQTPSAEDLKRDRNRGVVMLQLMKDYLKEYYYDANFHGMDLDARFRAAETAVCWPPRQAGGPGWA